MKFKQLFLFFLFQVFILNLVFAQKNSRIKADNEAFASFGMGVREWTLGLGYERDLWDFKRGKHTISAQIDYQHNPFRYRRSHFAFLSIKYNYHFNRFRLSVYPSVGEEFGKFRDGEPCAKDNLPTWAVNMSSKLEIRRWKMTVSGVVSWGRLKYGGYIVPDQGTRQITQQIYRTGDCVPLEWVHYWGLGFQIGKFF